MKYKLPFLVLLTTFHLWAAAQDTLVIPIDRQYFHDRIIDEQKETDRADKTDDGKFSPTGDENIDLQLTDALNRKITALRLDVESEKLLPTRNEKVRHLRYIEMLVRNYRLSWKSRQINPVMLPELVQAFAATQYQAVRNLSVTGIVKSQPYAIARILAQVFDDRPEARELDAEVYLKYIQLHPGDILATVGPYINEPFADSLIAVAARRNPGLLYNYAQAKNTSIGRRILDNEDKAVKIISSLSAMPTGLNYFPFFDDLYRGNTSIAEIEKIVGDGVKDFDSVGYFKLLVKTEIEYARRLRNHDTAYGLNGPNGIKAALKYRALRHFITPINELHEKPVPVRMQAIQPLNAQELYYMIVMGEEDIYTSSYKHSFARLTSLAPQAFHGDTLLRSVNFDYFRRFIKMAANYNQLDGFLASMVPGNAQKLMKAFAANLDAGEDLEDAVDVADAYSSITNPELRKVVLSHIKTFEEEAVALDNHRGTIIYGLLHQIFDGVDNPAVDLTKTIGIPSIYDVNLSALQDAKGRIVQQVFFYGDEDGKAFFPPFVNSFSGAQWEMKSYPEWVEFKSRKGEVYVYANKPLDYNQNLDDSAQVHLAAFLQKNDMKPSVVVHRGHSYWLPGTLNRMMPDAKIIVLGSCGGYKNLSAILNTAPDAHIISTKEIGAGDINRPILNYLNQSMIDGKPIEWKPMWATLTKFFADDPSPSIRESWQDYVPPYKNLGAIFIKACNKKIEEDIL